MLFNKRGNGTEELRKFIGFLYSDTHYENLEMDVLTATEDIQEIVSESVINAAESHYNSEDYLTGKDDNTKLLDKLVASVQLPIALFSIYSFMKSADVSHQDTGRKVKISAENEKIPFQWMLERDDRETLKKANKALDRLITFLDKNIDKEPISTTWKTSEECKKSKRLMINSAKDFDAIFPIDRSRQFFIRISSFILETERKFILPIIGETKYTTIKNKISTGNPELDDKEKKIIEISGPALVFLSLKMAIERLNSNQLPEEIFSVVLNDEDKNNGNKDLRKSLIVHFSDIAKPELLALQSYITKINTPEGEIKTPKAEVSFVNEKFMIL